MTDEVDRRISRVERSVERLEAGGEKRDERLGTVEKEGSGMKAELTSQRQSYRTLLTAFISLSVAVIGSATALILTFGGHP